MIARPNLFSAPGGDTIQIKETANALCALGLNVDIIINNKVSYQNYHLLHFFNIIDPEDILGHVYRSNLPYVVSTIYVDYKEYDKKYRNGLLGTLSHILPYNSIEYLKTLGKFILKNEKVSTIQFFLKGHGPSIKYILKHAKMLLPNSENEYRRIEKDYNLSQKYMVVPNGFNPDIFKNEENIERDLILCVGRIEGRKNQLNVIKALKNTKYMVIFIGAPSPNQKKYVQACKNEATENMQFIDHVEQIQLINYYKQAKVHVLASWFETTGLSNLEAAAMGCNIVIANRGDVKDYFGDSVYYCEPDDIDSIRENIVKAYNSPTNDALQKIIFDNFTWMKAGIKTLEAYKTISNV
jgi:glycosyltransferase involved in cell wall biosynthesis